MTMQEHDPLAGHPDLVALGATPELPPPGAGRRFSPWLIGIGVIVAAAAAIFIWWILASTVSTGTYDDVVAERDAVQAEFDAAQLASSEQIATLTDEVTRLEGLNAELVTTNADLDRQLADLATTVGAITEQRDALQAQAAGTAVAVDAMAYSFLNIDSGWFAELQNWGVDEAPYDELLAQLGHEQGIEEWLANGNAWFRTNAAVAATNDAALIEAWTVWNETPVDSVDDWIAWGEFNARLNALLVESTIPTADLDAGTLRAARPDGN